MKQPESTTGLLVMHYGTPASLNDVLPYYTHIRGGRPPTKDLLDDLVSRYKSIGGPSPLTEISQRQAELIQAGLHNRGISARLYVGAKHTHPFIAEAIEIMVSDGIQNAVGIVLAPHFSTYSVASYQKYALEALDKLNADMKFKMLERWGDLPEFIDALGTRLQTALSGLVLDETLVIFSAHSLPAKILETGDPYKSELLATSELVAKATAIPHWTFAFQSASTTGEPWLGPDVLDAIESNKGKYKNIVSCTVGFISDHLEVLYDLGVEAREKCKDLGLNFKLCEVINGDEKVFDALAEKLADLYKA